MKKKDTNSHYVNQIIKDKNIADMAFKEKSSDNNTSPYGNFHKGLIFNINKIVDKQEINVYNNYPDIIITPNLNIPYIFMFVKRFLKKYKKIMEV